MKHVRWTLVLAVWAMVAAACAQAPEGAPPGEEVNLEGVELQLMGWASSEAEDQALRGIIDGFNEETGATASFNPVPEYDATLGAALAGGEPPDVFYVDSFRLPDLVDAGTLAPAEGKITNPDDFYPSLREAFTFDGTFYCPPKDFSTLGLVYDQDVLEEAGLGVPTTWEELAAAAEALTTGEQAGLAMGVEYPRWGVFLFQNGTALTDDEVTEMTIDTPEARQALEYVAGLYQNGHAVVPANVDTDWAGQAFGEGKAAMTIEGNWIVPYLEQNFPEKNWAVAELPAGPAGQGTFAFTVCYGVPQGAANPDASFALANYLTDSDQMIEFTGQFQVMPSRASLRDQWVEAHPELEAFASGAEYSHPWQFKPGFGDVLGVFNSGAQGLTDGSTSIDQVVEETNQAGEDVLGG
jgi:multiple sugar transport system substrate-binding protein